MTYQRNMRRGLRLEVEEDVFDEAREGEIGDPEVSADDRDGDDDDHRRGEELAPVGPFDLLQLADRLGCEAAEAATSLPARTGLTLRLADRLDLAAALAGALGGGRLLEAGAFAAGALRTGHVYLVSRWRVCEPHQRQYFFASKRSGVFRFDFCV
jgi:hypothetical protein